MGECLRTTCPCLETLWQRVFSDKTSPSGQGGGEKDSSTDRKGVESARSPGTPVPPQEEGPESGSIYTALWSFEGRHKDELSFQDGDLFNVISRSGDWWTARKIDMNGRVLDTGKVPYNYLSRAETLRSQPTKDLMRKRVACAHHTQTTTFSTCTLSEECCFQVLCNSLKI
uniref:tyrosine-protein kinase HCK-like n=1 Tax=Solea senegalensis TaxID=28829 RepID=UPI001CD84438|nr:tyrosine-protein kinase HCK-like [Solea senegalensis]